MALSPLAISLLMQPPPAPPRPGQVAPTDVQGAFNASTQEANTQYQAKLAQQNAMWGGLAGLGGAGIVGASKIPAIQNAVGNWMGGGAPATWSFPEDAASSAAAAPDVWNFGSAASAAPSVWNFAADSGGAGAADAGSVAAADAGLGSVGGAALGPVAAADAAGTAAAGAGAADAGAFSVADLLPFLFAV